MRVADRPNVRIQVLPFAAGIPPVSAGSFSILESRATGAQDVVYLENKTRIFFVDGEPEVHRYARDFDLLTEMARYLRTPSRPSNGSGLRPMAHRPPRSLSRRRTFRRPARR